MQLSCVLDFELSMTLVEQGISRHSQIRHATEVKSEDSKTDASDVDELKTGEIYEVLACK